MLRSKQSDGESLAPAGKSLMQVEIWARSHNSYNGGPFSALGRLITKDMPPFGTAIKKFRIEPYFDDVKNAIPGGEQSFQEYKQSLLELPDTTFSRKNKNLTFRYFSHACLGADFDGKAMPRDAEALVDNDSANIIRAFYAELIVALEDLADELKDSDDFDLDGFLNWLKAIEVRLPDNNAAAYKWWRGSFERPEEAPTTQEPSAFAHKDAMTQDEFWKIMARVDQRALEAEDQHRAARPVTKQLSKLSIDKIKSFHNHLANALFALDTRKHCQASPPDQTDDSFLYLRCYVIGKGRSYYESVLANPSNMPKQDMSFECIMSCAPDAWAIVTNDDSLNWDYNCTEQCFGSFVNEAGWEE
jgi:hypothetical protein